MVAQIAAGAWAFHNKSKLEETVRNSVKYSVQEEYGVISERTSTLDSFQKNVSNEFWQFHAENILIISECPLFVCSKYS